MADKIEKLVRGWNDTDLTKINLRIEHLEKRLYRTYEPDKFHNGDFWSRLLFWLDNVSSDEDKQTLFRLVPELLYVGPAEFEELYRCAYEGPIKRWLADLDGIDVSSPTANDQITQAAQSVWFCPVTDSLRINAFYHINNLPAGANLRPDWCSIHSLGDVYKLNRYCEREGIRRLVLLEDFVGGGSQSLEAVKFAATHIHDLEVLFVPLMICPNGAANARQLASSLKAMRPNALNFAPVMELPAEAFLTQACDPFEQKKGYVDSVHNLLASTYPTVSGGAPIGLKPYHPYGYPSNQPTGGLVVMYSNTPDNTLPLIHWRPATNTWNPLFHRHSRV